MKHPITMPVLSDTMETGRLVRWLKKPGDSIKKGEVIAEVESDKALMELEAFQDGFLAGPLAQENSDIPVKTVIGWIADSREETLAKAPQPETIPSSPPTPSVTTSEAAVPAPAAEEAQPKVESETSPGTLLPPSHPETIPASSPVLQAAISGRPTVSGGMTPLARELAQELNIDPQTLAPGTDGVIRAGQVLAAALSAPAPDLRYSADYEIKRPSGLREKIAENMAATTSTPMFQLTTRVQLKNLHDLAKQRELSLTLLMARVCASTVQKHPLVNAAWTPKGLAWRKQVDVAIAVDTPDGLISPVLRDVADRPLEELAEDWRILKDKTQRRRLQPGDYEGASFYLSNLGVFPRVLWFDAIVPLGASAIIAVAAADKAGRCALTVSCDHRVLAGADAARFMEDLSEAIEKAQVD